jgi:polar amino acid transport system substrate-binding protein
MEGGTHLSKGRFDREAIWLETVEEVIMRLRWIPVASVAVLLLLGSTQLVMAEPGANGIDPGSYVGGDGSLKKYQQNGIRVGYLEAYPVGYMDPATGKRTGFDTEIAVEALRRIGITKIEYVQTPWEAIFPGLVSGRWDFIISDVHVTPERLKTIDFTTPAFYYGENLWVRKGNPLKIHTWEDLKGKVVGVGLGANYAEWLQKRNDLKDLKFYKTVQDNIVDLAAGRYDVFVGDEVQTGAFLAQNPSLNQQVERVTGYISQNPYDYTRFGCRKGDVDFNNAVSRALDEMRADGTMVQILSKWGMGRSNM